MSDSLGNETSVLIARTEPFFATKVREPWFKTGKTYCKGSNTTGWVEISELLENKEKCGSEETT